jgi:hypothetical protein
VSLPLLAENEGTFFLRSVIICKVLWLLIFLKELTMDKVQTNKVVIKNITKSIQERKDNGGQIRSIGVEMKHAHIY